MATTVKNNSIWGQRTFCLITGASRGIGHEIALQFAEKVGPDSVFLLVARNENGLKDAKTKIEQANKSKVVTVSVDLSNPDSSKYLNIIQSALSGLKPEEFEQTILVHNAGSLESSAYAYELNDAPDLQRYYSFNVVSVQILTWAFMQVFKKNRTIVHITSLAALQPFKGMSLYCSSKACRDMYFQVLAEEDKSVSVISYSPGPVDTDMYTEASNSRDPEIQECFKGSKSRGEVLTCTQTVTRLVGILQEQKFKSGEHIDYYWKDG